MAQLLMESQDTVFESSIIVDILKKGGSSSVMTPITSSEKLADAVELYVQRYFDLHGAILPPSGVYQRILREIELPLIEISLEAVAGNQAKCADLLGMNRNTLRKKIRQLEIVVTRHRKMM